MTAKETIKKIADALNIVQSDDIKKTEETTEVAPESVEEKVEEAKEEATVEVVDDSKTEETPEETKEVEVEEAKEEAKPEEEKVDENNERISQMEKQLEELQKLLEAAVSSENEKAEAPTIEEDVKPLTHSPETKPEVKHTKIGGHGGTILDRVYKYIN